MELVFGRGLHLYEWIEPPLTCFPAEVIKTAKDAPDPQLEIHAGNPCQEWIKEDTLASPCPKAV